MRIVFMGTPPFAATILQRLVVQNTMQEGVQHEVVGVYCQPDRPAGRGHKRTPSVVKVLAESLGLPVLQPLNFKDPADVEALRLLKPDVLAVAAYGLILPQVVLDIPVLGPWNVHASLLPRYRGAAPIERAIMAGDTQTGVTIMRMEAGLDTGPMALQRALGIGVQDTAANLLPELAEMGATLLLEVLESLPAVSLVPQETARATYAAKLSREDGIINWNRPVHAIHAVVRGVTPRPGARTVLSLEGDAQEVIFSPGVPLVEETAAAPGTVLPLRRLDGIEGAHGVSILPIVCADGIYGLTELRPANRKAMSVVAFVNGYARGVLNKDN